MTPDAWQALSAIIATIGAATSAVAVAMISRTKAVAQTAVDNTDPVSNGFARGVRRSLDEAARRSTNNEIRLEWVIGALSTHLGEHALGAPPSSNSRVEPFDPSMLR